MKELIGLAFEGGGGKGAYQIGVWKALHEIGLDKKIHAVSGTSVGALNACLFAYGDYALAEDIWLNLTDDIVFSNYPKNQLSLHKRFYNSVYTREGLGKILKRIDFNLLKEKSISCYAAALRVNKNLDLEEISEKEGKRIPEDTKNNMFFKLINNGLDSFVLKNSGNPIGNSLLAISDSGQVQYFRLKDYSEEEQKDILLASSAIPILFPNVCINGNYYIDAGLKDNLPFAPLYKMGCRHIVLIHCNRDSVIEKNDYHDATIYDIIPQKNQHGYAGMLDFSQEGIKRRIQQGYEETKCNLDKLEPLLNNIYKIDQITTKRDRTDNTFGNKYPEISRPNQLILDSCESEIASQNMDLKSCVTTYINHIKENQLEITRFLFSAVHFLTSNNARKKELKEQDYYIRLWKEIAGKNEKLREVIQNDEYAFSNVISEAIINLSKSNRLNIDVICAIERKINRLERTENDLVFRLQSELRECYIQQDDIKKRLDALELRVELIDWCQGIKIKRFDGIEYRFLPELLKLVCVVNDFYRLMRGVWNEKELEKMKQALCEVGLDLNATYSFKQLAEITAENRSVTNRLLKGVCDSRFTRLEECNESIAILLKNRKLETKEQYVVKSIEKVLGKTKTESKKILINYYISDQMNIRSDYSISLSELAEDLLLGLRLVDTTNEQQVDENDNQYMQDAFWTLCEKEVELLQRLVRRQKDNSEKFSSVLKEIMWDHINTIYPIIDKVSEELNKDSTGFKMRPDELERIITIITTLQQIRDKQNV